MRLGGFLLVCCGFLGGAYLLSVSGDELQRTAFALAMLAGIAGVALLRVDAQRRGGAEQRVAADLQTVERSLARVVLEASALDAEKESVDVYDLPSRIDERFPAELERFVDARESLVYAYGLDGYAGVMSHFAAGERFLNRVWSCSVDGYVDEAHRCLARARDQFLEAQTMLDELSAAKRAVRPHSQM